MAYTYDPNKAARQPVSPLTPAAGVVVAPSGSHGGARPADTYDAAAVQAEIDLAQSDAEATAAAALSAHNASASAHLVLQIALSALISQQAARIDAILVDNLREWVHGGDESIAPTDTWDGATPSSTYSFTDIDGGTP